MSIAFEQEEILTRSKELIAHIEKKICDIYEITPTLAASDFLISDALLAQFLQAYSGEKCQQSSAGRAGLWLFRENNDELFIGLHFEKALHARIHQINPLEQLTHHNLDSFCVFVEEVSHFHLLNQRLAQKRGVSQLELEWQGEIDKTLLAAALLTEQAGDAHLRLLAQKIYDEAHFISSHPAEHYRAANYYAGKFWHKAIAQGIGERLSLYDPSFMHLLRENYHKPVEEKFPFSAYLSKSA